MTNRSYRYGLLTFDGLGGASGIGNGGMGSLRYSLKAIVRNLHVLSALRLVHFTRFPTNYEPTSFQRLGFPKEPLEHFPDHHKKLLGGK